jgi:hypothetical protein
MAMTRKLVIAVFAAALLASTVPVLQAGVSDALTTTKKKPKKKKKKPKVRTKTVTVTVTTPATEAPTRELAGTFKLTPGAESGGKVRGSFFRMILPGGTAARGPFFSNLNSRAADKTYTLFNPGTDGGLVTGSYQEAPNPAFSGSGQALANKIVTPTSFFGVNFSLSTSKIEPQTGKEVPAPTITVSNGKLSGDLRAFTASWNGQWFQQGSPKPDGARPGITSPLTGTFDEKTKQFSIDWDSRIVGGPFNGFAGHWHFEGTFVPCG